MAIESACIPLPSEIIMTFSGFLVSVGTFSLTGVTLAGAFGNLLGSWVAYVAGRFGGRKFLENHGKYFLISNEDLIKADQWFLKYGEFTVFATRMLPLVRTFISLPAGISKMNFVKFSIYSFVGSIPWCFGLAYLGKELGVHWRGLGPYFHQFDFLIILGLIFFIFWFKRANGKKKNRVIHD
ncbi:MAG: DedA family protein [Nitrospirae bacterium]|nr:DedA family protein [Nitrospirota bacterium]MBI3351453.1 DedA family protein [Nitrospirota bacterium]